jgi:CRISPR-associated protein Cas2
MHVLLVYDITSDRLRTKIADICLDYGLERVQYSVFQGELTTNRQGELMQKVKRKLGKSPGSVLLFPLCQRDLALKREVVNRGGADTRVAAAPF